MEYTEAQADLKDYVKMFPLLKQEEKMLAAAREMQRITGIPDQFSQMSAHDAEFWKAWLSGACLVWGPETRRKG